MELVLGKKFKLEVWETIIYKMSLNEVSRFTVDKSVSVLKKIIDNILHTVFLNVPITINFISTFKKVSFTVSIYIKSYT